MRLTGLAILVIAAVPAAGQEQNLSVDLTIDKTDCVIGEDILIHLDLANRGKTAVEVSPLMLEDRSISFEVTFEPEPGKKQMFALTRTWPDPHVAARLPLPKAVLATNRSVSALFRVPSLTTGEMSVAAIYRGAGAEVRSSAIRRDVRPQADGSSRLAALLETSEGDLRIDLLPREAPNNVANFVTLARAGFFDNMLFHHVVRNGWIQSGCPYDNGFGHPGYALRSEAEAQTVLHEAGTVALASNMKTGYTGSQFFIMLRRHAEFDKQFTVVGKLGAGLDVAQKIGNMETEGGRPKKEVRLKSVRIVAVQ